MSDLKSKLPDINELSSMAGKLFTDLKKSVGEIIDTYKQKHDEICTDAECETKETTKKTTEKTEVETKSEKSE